MLIAQISDPHLRPAGELYRGVANSNDMLRTAVRQLQTMRPSPDVVILTGDLTDEGTAPEYDTAAEILAEIAQPLLVIPGNHDDRELLRQRFAGAGYLPEAGPLHYVSRDHGAVRLVALDVTVPNEHHGDMTAEAAAWLHGVLAEAPLRPTIIMMHQPPFACGVPYLDTYMCRNEDRLAAVVAEFPAVELITCGHVHRFMQTRFGGTVACTAPSVSTAIALRLAPDAEPASYLEPPGMLLHHWHEASGVVTHLIPIGDFRGPFPFA